MSATKRSSLSLALLLGITGLFVLALFLRGGEQETIALWPSPAPGTRGDGIEDKPFLRAFIPPIYNNSRAAVIICPGGAYEKLTVDYEGEAIARWFNSIGVTAFVLNYRLAPRYHHPFPLEDGLRAMRLVRSMAEKLGINPGAIGIMGFSAGGHLASTVATHYNEGMRNPEDPIDKVSARPDFLILGYPIISLLPPYTHEPSVKNLLAENSTQELRSLYSSHLHVNRQSPPTFLFHAIDDRPVPPENSLLMYKALKGVNVPVELHLYERGKHGAGLADGKYNAPTIPLFASWPELLQRWMVTQGLLAAP